MKERGILWCIFHHPLKIIIRTVVIWFAMLFVLGMLNGEFGYSDSFYKGSFLISLVLGAFRVKKLSNAELRQQYAAMSQTQWTGPQPRKKKKSLLFGALKSMDKAMNRSVTNAANSVGDAFINLGRLTPQEEAELREKNRKANEAAWNRWHARDMQKKAEFDARAAARRGDERGAYQRQHDANYWRNESRR